MSTASSGKFYISAFAGVRVIECRDHIRLTPVPSFRECFAYGEVRASEVTIDLENGKTEPFWDNCAQTQDINRALES